MAEEVIDPLLLGSEGDDSGDESGKDGEGNDQGYQGCYLFIPRNATDRDVQRPSKKRKTSHERLKEENDFLPLSGSLESAENARVRHAAYRKCWTESEERISHLREPFDEELLEGVVNFVGLTKTRGSDGQLQTGLIEFGPSGGSHTHLLERWRNSRPEAQVTAVVQLEASQAPNLMTTLKNLIRAAIVDIAGISGYQEFLDKRKRKIQMPYDLELLHEFARENELQQCAIVLTEVELFDTALLSDLIRLLHSWSDRIPLVLLLGISTTVELLEARLPKSVIRLLDCRLFPVSKSDDSCSQIFSALQAQHNKSIPILGPLVAHSLRELSVDHDASPVFFSRAIYYTFMSHYFANPLSALLDRDYRLSANSHELCEAVRSVHSFRDHCENLIADKKASVVRDLLIDDQALLKFASDKIEAGQVAVHNHFSALALFSTLANALDPEQRLDFFSLQCESVNRDAFVLSETYKAALSAILELSSPSIHALLTTLSAQLPLINQPDFSKLLKSLNSLTAQSPHPIQSAQDPSRPKTRTTVKNNTITLSTQAPTLTPLEKSYTALVEDLCKSLRMFFPLSFVNPRNLLLNEIFVYDFKTPLATGFSARPRSVLERALERPADYLGCECCGSGAGGVAGAPTSILWRLWCEAVGTVNVKDLWDAFRAIVGTNASADHEGDDEDEVEGNDEPNHESGGSTERLALALFYRGLAELRMLGLVRQTKRKPDCLAKTTWRGL